MTTDVADDKSAADSPSADQAEPPKQAAPKRRASTGRRPRKKLSAPPGGGGSAASKGAAVDSSSPGASNSPSSVAKQSESRANDETPRPKRARLSRTRSKASRGQAAAEKDGGSAKAVTTSPTPDEQPANPKRPRKKAATTGAGRRRTGKAEATEKAGAVVAADQQSESVAVSGSADSGAPRKTTPKKATPRKRTRTKKAPAEAVVEEAANGKKQASTTAKKRAPRKRASKKKADASTTESTSEPAKDEQVDAKLTKQATTKQATTKQATTKQATTKTAAKKTPAKKTAAKKKPAKKKTATKKTASPVGKADAGAAGKTSRSRRSRTATKREAAPDVHKEMIISVDVGEQRVAVIEDDTVVEVYLERRGGRSVAGSIYKGVVDNVLPGMEASFVDIGLERNGFLYVGEIVMPELEDGGNKRGRRIQDLISRGQEVLVQAVKDPMGSKGARLTTEISLPGRFVVFVPYGDGIGISRRLDDDERERLKKLCKGLDLPEGGIIVRTAAEGASQAELEGDLALLRKLWATILGRSNRAEAPTLVYREAELPLRLVRDLFIRDFGRLVVDHEQTHRRLVGYLKRTSPELAARVELDAAAESIMQRHGVDNALRSTLSRHVPLPSGGSLVFDYAEALTVIDVNTGRFVGAKGSKTSLEDTITANNLEAAREVVRQLRLRDIGGIIVIDFIDMANSRNRKAVEAELSKELARDRTKTYVVEISPLGLVEMTRQNVTDGPREILTIECPTCSGEGVVLSEESIVINVERALRSRAIASSAEGLLVELNERIARRVIGPGGDRLAEFEDDVGRRVFVESRDDVALDYFEVLAEGTAAEMEHRGLPVSPGEELELELELLDEADAIGRRDGYVVVVAGAGSRVGERVQVVVDRVTRTVAYASLQAALAVSEPPETLTAEAAIGVDGATGELDHVELPELVPLGTSSDSGTGVADAADAPASGPESEDAADAGSEAKPATKRRRRRRSSRKKADTAASNGENLDGAVPESADSPEAEESTKPPRTSSRPRKKKKTKESAPLEGATAEQGEVEVAAPGNGAAPAKPKATTTATTASDAAKARAGAASSDADADGAARKPTRRSRSTARRRRARSGAASGESSTTEIVRPGEERQKPTGSDGRP